MKYLKVIFIFLYVLNCQSINAQNTFDLWISSEEGEILFDALELSSGSFILTGGTGQHEFSWYQNEFIVRMKFSHEWY
jgi:hypothetical protein